MDRPAPLARPRPSTLTAAAVLVGLEGAALVVLAGVEVASLTSGRLTMGFTTTVFLGLCGAGLLACAWGLSRCRSWGRGPAVLAQLITLGLAWNFRGGATAAFAALLAVVGVVGLAAIFARPSLTALEAGRED